MDPSPVELYELQSQIGLNEELTDKVLCKVNSLPPSPKLFPIYNLLLLERYDSTIPLLKLALGLEIDIEYIGYLQKSKYYIQRRCVPNLITELCFPEKKYILKKSLSDPICEVVKEAIQTIKLCSIFNEEELMEIAIELFNSKYTAIKILSIDILTLVKNNSFLLSDTLKANNWRIRLKLASTLLLFSSENQKKIIFEIKNDIVEEVRIELSKNLKTLDYIDLLQDPSEYVRANYLKNVVDQIEDENTFRTLIEDPSWEVKKILLNLGGELFKKVTIPLIRSNVDSISWRIKYDILNLVEEKIENEFVTKLMVGFLIKNLLDKVCEIRTKSQEILIKIIQKYHWMNEYYYDIEEITKSYNYLYRISVLPVALEFDIKMNTNLSEKLKEDRVINVIDFYNDYSNSKNIKLNYENVNFDGVEFSRAKNNLVITPDSPNENK